MADSTYTGTVTLSAGSFGASGPVPGQIFISNTLRSVSFTAVNTDVSKGNIETLTVVIPSDEAKNLPPTITPASVTYYPTSNVATPYNVNGLTAAASSSSSQGIQIPSTTVSPATISNTTTNTPTPTTDTSSRSATSTSHTTKSSLPSMTGTPSPRLRGHSTGEVVGVAVGCLIAGAILAAAVLFVLMRRKSRRGDNFSGVDGEKSHLQGSDTSACTAGGKGWESHLPQADSDATIRNMANRSLDQIEMHVENFYKDTTNVQLSSVLQSRITAVETRQLPGPVLNLLSASSRPTFLIKHCIAGLVVSKTTADKPGVGSFLPTGFGGLRTSSTTQGKPAFAKALSHWRVLTAYLSAEAEDEAYHRQRDQSITESAQQICQAFEPWARSTHSEDARIQSLIGIMKRATEMGIVLFSQPSAFKWQWQGQWQTQGNQIGGNSSSTSIVVLPGLYKASEQGEQNSSSICVVEPRLGALS